MRNNQKGFTLIELLVVIAIIGLLSTLAVVALNSARERSRDSKRVADMRQIQTALEMYYADNNGYPDDNEGAPIVLGLAGTMRLCSSGWSPDACTGTTYMGLVPSAPRPSDGDCDADAADGTGTSNNRYTYELGAGGRSYTINFCIGSGVGDLSPGENIASESGIQAAPEAPIEG